MGSDLYVVCDCPDRFGSLIASKLLERGKSVRVVLCDLRKARRWRFLGAEITQARPDDPAALQAAFEGASTVIASHSPRFLNDDVTAYSEGVARAIARAAVASRLKNIVCISAIGAHLTKGARLLSMYGAFERTLASLPVPVSIVRAAWPTETWRPSLISALQAGILPAFLFHLDKNMPTVSIQDVADVAVELAMDATAPPRVVELIGPEGLSAQSVATLASDMLKRPIDATSIARPDWFRALSERGNSPASVEMWIELLAFRNGGGIEFEFGDENRLHGPTMPDAAIESLVRVLQEAN